MDETYLKVGGTWRYLFRAIDQFGQVIDVFLSQRRNTEAARQFFMRAIDRTRISPVEVTTDRCRIYPRLLDEVFPRAFPDQPSHEMPYRQRRDRATVGLTAPRAPGGLGHDKLADSLSHDDELEDP